MTEQPSSEVRAPIGTHDVMPPESARWEALLSVFSQSARRSGFAMVHTPLFEDARLFHRGIGDETEVVGKEMYEFEDRGGRLLALRPEGTASVVRAFIQHHPPVPFKAWYATPAFRYERPQAGRYRQHHQIGIEALGTADADLDVEVLTLASDLFSVLGLTDYTLKLNSMGDANCRPGYVATLLSFLDAHASELCDEHSPKYARNPLRVLDCKKAECRTATASVPKLADVLCEECDAHFRRVRAGLEALGIAYELDHRLVRGLDYYTRTTFEFVTSAIDDGEITICGGGRYDNLVSSLGGDDTPGIGFGCGIERLLLACDRQGVFPTPVRGPLCFVVDTTDGAAARDLVAHLRRSGIGAERAYDQRSMKSQLKAADRSGAAVALIIGHRELESRTVTIRPLRSDADQQSVPVDDLAAHLSAFVPQREDHL